MKVHSKKDLGNFLKQQRIKNGLSQKKVSQYLGYKNGQYISNIERGLSFPPFAKLSQIAKLYKIPKGPLVKRVTQLKTEKWLKSMIN